MAEAKTADPQEIAFEAGYEKMKQISSDLEGSELSVAEMCDRYAEGKGLGKALLGYLDEREGELKEIDEGKNLPQFTVTATAKTDTLGEDAQADTSDFAGSEPAAVGASDNDIPF